VAFLAMAFTSSATTNSSKVIDATSNATKQTMILHLVQKEGVFVGTLQNQFKN